MPNQPIGDQEVAITSSSGFPLDLPVGVVEDFAAGHIDHRALTTYVMLLWQAKERDDREFDEDALYEILEPLSRSDLDIAIGQLVDRGWVTVASDLVTVEETRGRHAA